MFPWRGNLSVVLLSLLDPHLKSRLEMGYDAANDARRAVRQGDYAAAARDYANALALGRKPALTLHEQKVHHDHDENENDKDDQNEDTLAWLIDVCCESAALHLNHLDQADQARSDAWAACVFSQYKQRKPLEIMRAVCMRQQDLIGELQVCQQLLSNLPAQDELQTPERQEIVARLATIEQQLENKR